MKTTNLKWYLLSLLLTFVIGLATNSLLKRMSPFSNPIMVEKPFFQSNEIEDAENDEFIEQEKAVRVFWADFQKAIADDNKKKVASMMKYPLKVNFSSDPRPAEDRVIENSSKLLQVYNKVFHEFVKGYIAKIQPGKVWGNSYYMQTGYGVIGIAVSRKNENGKCSYDFGIKNIASNMIVIDEKAERCGPTITCWIDANNEQNRQNTK